MQTHPADQVIFSLAARQHGAVARSQLRDHGVPAALVRRRVAQGVLEPLSSRVLVVTGSTDTIDRALASAVLDSGEAATISHETAAWRWGFSGFEPQPVHVTGRRRQTSHGRSDLAVLHQPRRLFPSHVITTHGLATTTPARTLFDLANDPHANPNQIERLLDRAWSRRLVDHWTIRAVLDDLAERGRTGITLMRRLLDARGPDHVASQTNLEDRFRDVLGDASAAGFRAQVNTFHEATWLGRVDFIHDRLGIVVEVDSVTFHSTITDRANDRLRQSRLESIGLLVIRVTEHDLWHDPAKVIAQVRAARRSRTRASGGQIAS